MLARNVTEAQVREAAARIDVDIIELRSVGRSGLRFRLAPIDGKYQRTSASYFNRGRKVHAVCWHGHRDFFRALFDIAPDARVQTAQTRRGLAEDGRRSLWYTAQNFEDTYGQTDRNIGSQIAPVYYSEACTHNEGSGVVRSGSSREAATHDPF